YLNNILKINNNAIAKKLAITKGANSEEKKLIEEWKAERLQNEQDTNDAIFDLRKKALEDQFNQDKANAQNKLQDVTDNPNSTPVQKEEAEQVFYEELLKAQADFNSKMDILENQYNQNSKDSALKRSSD